jgi:hypothetical protein
MPLPFLAVAMPLVKANCLLRLRRSRWNTHCVPALRVEAPDPARLWHEGNRLIVRQEHLVDVYAQFGWQVSEAEGASKGGEKALDPYARWQALHTLLKLIKGLNTGHEGLDCILGIGRGLPGLPACGHRGAKCQVADVWFSWSGVCLSEYPALRPRRCHLFTFTTHPRLRTHNSRQSWLKESLVKGALACNTCQTCFQRVLFPTRWAKRTNSSTRHLRTIAGPFAALSGKMLCPNSTGYHAGLSILERGQPSPQPSLLGVSCPAGHNS